MDNQKTRCYLLDIRAPAGTTPRRVRVEALLKVGTWFVAPMEVRIVVPTVPDAAAGVATASSKEDLAPLNAPSSTTAEIQLLRYLDGLPPELPEDALAARGTLSSATPPRICFWHVRFSRDAAAALSGNESAVMVAVRISPLSARISWARSGT